MTPNARRALRRQRLKKAKGPLNRTAIGTPEKDKGYLDVRVERLPPKSVQRIRATSLLIEAFYDRIDRKFLDPSRHLNTTELEGRPAARERWRRDVPAVFPLRSINDFHEIVDQITDGWDTQGILKKRAAQLLMLNRWLRVFLSDVLWFQKACRRIEKNHLAQGSRPSNDILQRDLVQGGFDAVRRSIVLSYLCGVPTWRVRLHHYVFRHILSLASLYGREKLTKRQETRLRRLEEHFKCKTTIPHEAAAEMTEAWVRGVEKFRRLQPFLKMTPLQALYSINESQDGTESPDGLCEAVVDADVIR